MKKHNLSYIIFFLLFISGLKSQETQQIPLEYNTSGYSESNGTPLQKTVNDPLIPTISAEMSVAESGALTYTLPIEIHKGVNDFQPNIALAYNSQSGNGMAGWGWNIVGLSSISIGGKNKEIEGITKGPQYDNTDPYYLDGQRLIKIDASTFVTEKYSKIKITKPSSGEFQFIIQYTDGKIAKYKELTPGQFYISVFQDAFNNTINYTYQVENYVAKITKISYGSTGSADPFSINFEYKLRKAQTEAYRNGVKFINKYILSNIYSSSTADGIFRKYTLTHDFINSNTNERIRRIDVENKAGLKLKPLDFDYNLGVTTGTVEKASKSIAGFPQETKELGDIVAGDFYGNGELSTCYIAKGVDGSFSLINSSYGKVQIPVEPGSKLIVGKTLTSDNKISERDQLIIANTGLFATLKVVDLLTMNTRTMSTGFQANGTWNWNIITGEMTLDLSKSSDNYVSGDFNNDGLLDLIHFVPRGTYNPAEVRLTEVGKELGAGTTTEVLELPDAMYFSFDQVYQIEMDGDGIPELLFIDADKYSVYKVDYLEKKLVPMANLQKITLPDFVNNIYTKRFTPLIFGDFNGDGLTDFMTPKKIYYIDKDNSAGDVAKRMETESQMWWQYISTGTSFIATSKDYTAQKLSYIVPSQRSYFRAGGSFWKQLWSGPDVEYDYTEYGATTIIPTDFNNDGKTDLISFSKFGKVKYSDTQKLSLAEVQNLDVRYFDPTSGNAPWFMKDALYTNKIYFHENVAGVTANTDFTTLNTVLPLNTDMISPFSVPLQYTNFNYLNTYKSKLVISDPYTKRDISFTINNDRFTEQLIKKVSNGSDVDQQVDYKPMMADVNNNLERCYTQNVSIWEYKYPYYVHKNNGTSYLVNKIHTLFDGKALTKEYRYENAVQHLWGKGFLGFQKTFASDAYESELKNGKYINKNPTKAVFWTITTRDASIDNAVLRTTYGGINKYITDNHATNAKFDRGNHQYLILTTDEVNKDNLRKITITKKYDYDEADDLKLKKASTDYNGIGSSVSNYIYKPEFFNGDHYFYGKIASVENIAYKGGLSFTEKNESDYYPNGNASETRKFGNQAGSLPITVSYTYDNFGNVKTETSSTQGITPQTIAYEYDSTNRYVNKTTTPDGLISTAVVNGLGRTTSEISSLGLNTAYNYDEWGNIIEITDFLGKKTTISKSVADPSTGGVYNLHKKREGSAETIATFDKFDREIQMKTQSVNGKWIVTKTGYDIFGKKIKSSEPLFDGETPKWNTIEYDEMNRPVKNIAFTGKVITTCYEGMKVTVEDGYKKTSKTLDAMGHTIKQQDHGGVITYSYYPNGILKESNYEGIKTSFEIDGWGNKTKMTDPSAGVFTYEYDNLSRITKETNPKGYILYTYDALGRPLTEKTYGNTPAENTNIETSYTYNGQTKLPETITGISNGNTFTYTTYYDQYYRIKGKKEETPDFTYTSSTTFDSYGRADIVTMSTVVLGYTSDSSIKNVYDSNGILVQQNNNDTGSMVWHLSDINARGQNTQMEYGNGYTITSQYNQSDLSLQNLKHQNTSNGTVALDIDYNYDVNKGVLNWRRNNTFNKKEDFTYDKLNRLLSEAVNGVVTNQYTYDKRGRITSNTELGKYNYNETDYKLKGIDFNANGQNVSTNRGFAAITYNAFKSPLTIKLAGKEDLTFEYNILKTRYSMTSAVSGKRKYYSSDFAVEITKRMGKGGGTIEIVTYLNGSPYTANYIKKDYIKVASSLHESNNYYLHRDNQGSILAITKADGSVVEKRFFDAWGNLKSLVNESGQVVTDAQQLASGNIFLDRGYTGHEHLWKAGLINMNARLYDPVLRKFLSPDNVVADPFNTQSYDRFSYVLNNPLLYIDIDGNEPITIGFGLAIAIAAAIGITTKIIINAINGLPVWYGLGKAAVTSAVMGAVSFGIGSVATSAAVGFIGKAALQAGMHAMSGGIMSTLESGNFGSGFLSGAVSSLISSGIQALGTNFTGNGAMQDANRNYISMNSFGRSDLMKAVMVAAGGISGGISSTIAGGNFWQGFRQGIITSGLNHVAHMTTDYLNQRETRQAMLQTIKEQYPRFYKVLSQLKSFLEANPKVLSTLSEDSGLSKVEILTMMDIKSPEGQIIKLGQMKDFGRSLHPKSYINADLVKVFEGLQTPEFIQGTSFLLAITVLHEFVHWGRVEWGNKPGHSGGLPSDAPTNKWRLTDYGDYWEKRTFGEISGVNQETINRSYQYNWKF
ncbi:RHS repeat-associated core domain-containing protein [Chryseobacterium sp. MIQD13]|uniref:RHS repeat-associated core domain-containing protein n=1 Tax=Chryseobacterium sp. MIQD13 TaxID=3422310 RepID=UPI003D2AA036